MIEGHDMGWVGLEAAADGVGQSLAQPQTLDGPTHDYMITGVKEVLKAFDMKYLTLAIYNYIRLCQNRAPCASPLLYSG